MDDAYLQVRWSTSGRLPLARDEDAHLAIVRRLARAAGARLLLFNVVDEHIHAVIDGRGCHQRRLLQGLTQALRKGARLPPLSPTWCEPVTERRHLINLLGYITRQASHHGLRSHDATWPGGCLADLIGARALTGFDRASLAAVLPRVGERQLLETVGLSGIPEVVDVLPGELAAAAAAAVGRSTLAGRDPAVVRARLAAVHVARARDLPTTEVARALPLCPRTIQRVQTRPPDAAMEAVILRQLGLREAVRAASAAAARGEPPPMDAAGQVRAFPPATQPPG